MPVGIIWPYIIMRPFPRIVLYITKTSKHYTIIVYAYD